MNSKVKELFTLLTLILAYSLFSYSQEKPSKGNTEFKYGGYVKFDAITTWYNNGNVGATSPLRDFVLPSQIPVGDRDVNQTLDFHVKESRFNFDVNTIINNQKIHGFLELDFLLSSQGDEKVSNSFSPRLRHFYFEWNRLLIGQTWSTFMVVVVPDDLDFAGSLEGLVFVRQPQIRYKAGSWMFSLENPESVVLPYGSPSPDISDKEFLPDVTVRKNFKGNWGTWSIAGIYRTLSITDTAGTHRTAGFGITTGGKLRVGQKGDDFRMVATVGTGIGRYVAAGFLADGYRDVDSKLSTMPLLSGYVAYNHFWKENILSSSFNLGYFQYMGNDQPISKEISSMAYSVSANLKYDPFPAVRVGVEFAYANRELIDATRGDLYRVQISAKYKFGFTDSKAIEK